MKVKVWFYDAYDLISPGGEYNILGFKENVLLFIDKKEIKVGEWIFVPNKPYTEIGLKRKTSAGFVYYSGDPIFYYGYYDGYLLFTKNEKPEKYENYIAVFFTFRLISTNHLFTLNRSGAGRILEMQT